MHAVDYDDPSPLTKEVVEMYDVEYCRFGWYASEGLNVKEWLYRVAQTDVFVDRHLCDVRVGLGSDGWKLMTDPTVGRFHCLMKALGIQPKVST